jgi:predicted dehydrogenase
MKKIRMGLIGCGNMMASHAVSINKVTEKLEIVAVCDIIESRAETIAKALNNDAYITTDWTTMVDKVDAVMVALPHDLHYECGVFFARNKKHIFMEKPLANTEEECVRLIDICEEEGVTLMCGYPMRYIPGLVRLKELLDSGEYGKIIMMSIWTEQLTKAEETSWKSTSRLGGGQLFSHGCHYIDLMLWFLGEPVQGSHLGTCVGTPWLMKEGTSALIMKFENGAVGYHGATWGARGTRLGYDFQVQTEKGMLEYDYFKGEIILYDKDKEHVPGEVVERVQSKVLEKYITGKQTQYEIGHFADCILENKRPITDGPSALQGLRVIWKLYEAEKNGVVADLRGLGLPKRD